MNFTKKSRVLGLALGAAGLLVASAGTASADPVKCQQGVAKETQKFLAKKSKLFSKCEESIAKGKLPPSTDCVAVSSEKIAKAEGKLQDKIEKACEGENPIAIGYPATCPDLEDHGCDSISLATPAGVGQCMVCSNEFAVDQLYALIGAPFVDATGNAALATCQRTIVKESQKFLKLKTKALQKCWDDRIKGAHSEVCPTADAAEKIAKYEAKLKEKLCKDCGGPDEVCGGTDGMGVPNDFQPAQIGFPAQCPAVTIPGGQECAVDVTNLPRLVDCIACVSEFEADCALSAATSQLETYPVSCDPPVIPACSSADVSVEVQFTPPVADVQGVTVAVNYPGQKLQLATVTQTNPQGGLFNFGDVDTPPNDGFNDLLNVGLVAIPGDIPPGVFADASYTCRAGTQGPDISEFSCTADVADSGFQQVPATCTVSLTNNP